VAALFLVGRVELQRRPLQSAAVALVLALAAGALALALSVGSSAPFEEVFGQAGQPHVSVVTMRTRDAKALRVADDVVAAAGPFTQTLGLVGARTDVQRSAVVRAATVVPPAVDRPLVSEGRWLQSAGELVVERSFARALDLEPGAAVTVAVRGGVPLRKRVVGIAVTVARGPYPQWTPGLVWMTPDAFARIVPAETPVEGYLALRLVDGEGSYQAVKEIREAVPGSRAFAWQQVEEDLLEDARTASAVLGALGAFALLAVAMIVANVVAGRVLSLRRDLAMLRALGATPQQVAGLLVGQQATLALAAAILGVCGAIFLGAPLLDSAADLLAVPPPSPALPALVAILIVVAATGLASLPAALQARRVAPLRALHGEPGARSPRRSRLAAAAAWLRLPVPIVVGVQDALARRGRAVLTVLSLMLTVATAVFALAMEATYDRILADPAIDGAPFELRVLPGALGEPATRALLARHKTQIASDVTIARLPATANGDSVQLRAFGGDVAAQPYNLSSGRMPRAAGEAMIAPGVTGIHTGDRLALAVGGRRLSVRVVGEYVDPSQDGRIVVVTRPTLERARIAITPPAHALTVRKGVDPHGLASQLERDSAGLAELQVTSDLYTDERNGLRPVVYGLLAVLLAVGLVNLVTTTLLTARERARDIATLKTLGMTPGQLYVGTSAGAGLLALCAAALGAPVGLLLYDALLVLLNPVDAAAVRTYPGAARLAGLVPAAVALACLTAVLPARSIARARVGDALRLE
jgi:putative ABC transport system permease protein